MRQLDKGPPRFDGAWFRLVISVHINLSQLHITFLFQTFSLVSRKVLAYMSEASLSLLGDCMFMVGCKCCMVERQISPLLLLDLAILNDYGPGIFSCTGIQRCDASKYPLQSWEVANVCTS